MPALRFAAVFVSFSGLLIAQNCSAPSGQRALANRAEFEVMFFFSLAAQFLDIDAQRPIAIHGLRTLLYDQGAGVPPLPNQVGNTAVVNVYTCPGSWLGQAQTSPQSPGSPWTLLGSGTLTVAAFPAETPVVFNPPLALPAGQRGVAIQFLAPTSGQNPGLLHTLGTAPPLPPNSDQFLTLSNSGTQAGSPIAGVAFTGTARSSPNLRVLYTPDAAAGYSDPIGAGCYRRPSTFFEDFAPAATPPDVANTAQRWQRQAGGYDVSSGTAAFVLPSSPSLTWLPPGSSSSANWDDALSAPITLPFVFAFPESSTNVITIGSNGYVYLASVVDNSFEACGGFYNELDLLSDLPPRLLGFAHDLDLSTSGSLHYDVDAASQFVRITWHAVPEFTNPTALNTTQLTLHRNGDVELVFGPLHNSGLGFAANNNAILGFARGVGFPLTPPLDFSTAMPFQSGDGAFPPVLALRQRPVLGTTVDVVTKDLVPGTLLQALAIGTTAPPTPVDLTSIGMPGCGLVINPTLLLTTGLNPATNLLELPLALPNNPALQNAQLLFQAAPLTPGYNPLGLLLSNGVCARLGQ